MNIHKEWIQLTLSQRMEAMASTALVDYEPKKSAAASSTAIVVASEPVVKKRTFNDLIMAGEHTKVNAAAATSAASPIRLPSGLC